MATLTRPMSRAQPAPADFRQARKARGLTQVDVAKFLGISAAAVSMTESGRRGVGDELRTRWELFLDLPPGSTAPPKPGPPPGAQVLVRMLEDGAEVQSSSGDVVVRLVPGGVEVEVLAEVHPVVVDVERPGATSWRATYRNGAEPAPLIGGQGCRSASLDTDESGARLTVGGAVAGVAYRLGATVGGDSGR